MATFSALVLQDSNSGQVYKVFLIRTEPNTPIPSEPLLAVQQLVSDRYNQSLTPVDLEVSTLDDLKTHVRKLNRGR